MIKEIAIRVFNETEQEANNYRNAKGLKKFDYKILIVCVCTAVSLTLIKYLSSHQNTIYFVEHCVNHNWATKLRYLFDVCSYAQLFRLSHWIFVLAICYVVIPMIVIKVLFKESLKNYGLSFHNAFKDYRLYLLMLAFMIPLVFAISFTQSFQAKYPFYQLSAHEPINTKFLIWELEYFFQFFALEFFFRGFVLHGLKHRFGFYSVFVMTIPYCMIHFAKPMPETIAAIVAGIVLGTLSLKSKNIWLGFIIHCSVAITMDVCALWQKGLLHF
jgi:membrane protease YdiL (CAAX protease family)